MGATKSGIYIHVPFCRTRCPFCDFAITTDLRDVEAWLEALEREIALRAAAWDTPFDTVYFGGGTPSLLKTEAVGRILDRVRARFRVEGDAEVTLEANPGTIERGDFARLLDRGVNRLSLGVQSFDEEDLRLLGRDHSVEDSLESFAEARGEGFQNIVLDLIYGLPGRTRADWGRQIERAAALGPEHVSAYQLTYEPGTALTRRKERGEIEEPSEGDAAELFLFTREKFEEAGFAQYEISSFARSPSLQSRHNKKYWEGAPYLGLGPSAHSCRDGERSWNTPRVKGYIEALTSGRDPQAGSETLSEGERRLERLALALRTTRGLDLRGFEAEFGSDLEAAPGLDRLKEGGLALLEGGVLRLTPRGLALADRIAVELSGPA